MAKLSVVGASTPVFAMPSNGSGILFNAQTGQHFEATISNGWVQVGTPGEEGYIQFNLMDHASFPDNTYQKIIADAAMYLRDTEQFRFADGLLETTGVYKLGKDYGVGDIVGLYDHFQNITVPVRIVEITTVIGLDGSEKLVPTFEKFVERKPDE